MKVKLMQVPIRARTSTGSTPRSAEILMPIGVRIDAAAALLTRLVKIVVPTANTATTRKTLPTAKKRNPLANTSANPLLTTSEPRPTDPARMNKTFQSSARTAERGVITPVRIIRTAPLRATIETGANPNDADTITPTSTATAIQVLPG